MSTGNKALEAAVQVTNAATDKRHAEPAKKTETSPELPQQVHASLDDEKDCRDGRVDALVAVNEKLNMRIGTAEERLAHWQDKNCAADGTVWMSHEKLEAAKMGSVKD